MAGRIVGNCRTLLTRLAGEADRRAAPRVAAAQAWHRAIYDGVALPVDSSPENVRDDDERYPELIGYEVAVGPNRGVPAADVPAALEQLRRPRP